MRRQTTESHIISPTDLRQGEDTLSRVIIIGNRKLDRVSHRLTEFNLISNSGSIKQISLFRDHKMSVSVSE